MNRRTLLKGTAGASTLMFSMRMGVHRTSAQLPFYSAEVIYEFTNFTEDAYRPVYDGAASDVSKDGTIVGSAVVNGRNVPVRWDLSGNQTVLDTGDIAFGTTHGLYINDAGTITGSLREGVDFTTRVFAVGWNEGIPDILEAHDPAVNTFVRGINNSGVIAGQADGVASRWIGGSLEQLPKPAELRSTYAAAISANGDTYVSNGSGGGSWAQRWKLDGTVDDISFPEDLLPFSAGTMESAKFPAVFDDGTFVANFYVNGAGGGESAVFDGVEFRLLPNLGGSSGSSKVSVSYAPSLQEIYGRMLIHGATVWLDGVLYPLRDQVALPEEFGLGEIIGATANGELVAQANPTIRPGILVLHPA